MNSAENDFPGKPTSLNQDSKQKQLDPLRVNPQGEFLTTDSGVRVNHTDDSLKAGSRGPTLMEDFHFRERMTHLDHQNMPERVVHARGSGAHGYFQVYESMASVTKAKFLSDPNVKTPLFVRFSTVVGSRGSADTVRDARGFAVKFYTEEGNYDLVGNNIPVFFIQDAIKFPDLVHAIKPDPNCEIPQASAAHDTFWDFISLMPESMHMIMWILSDRAIPRSFRMMEGFGVHTFRFINEAGESTFVKFHWRPVLGTHSLVWDEAQKLAGKDPDWLRRDLWEAIDKGHYPEFELGVQLVPEADEFKFNFDLLDATKLIPEELVPIKAIGKMTLNRNPDNFFAETEQAAFHPGHLVPGIDVTNDPLLQGRLFSYVDTQLNRFNSVNFNEVPINRPLSPVHHLHEGGYMRQSIRKGRVNYFPNSIAGGTPQLASAEQGGYVHHQQKVEGYKIRARSESFKDHYSQATLFWNSITETEKKHIVEAAHFELGKVEIKAIRERMLSHFNIIAPELAQRVAEGIGVEVPENFSPTNTGNFIQDEAAIKIKNGKSIKDSPAVSQEKKKIPGTQTRKVAILLEDGFNYAEVMAVKQAVMQGEGEAKIISKMLGKRQAATGEVLETDKSHITAGSIMFDAVYVAGGKESVAQMKKEGDALHFVLEAFKHGKTIGATGDGIYLIQETMLNSSLRMAKAVSGSVETDKGVVTAGETDDMSDFTKSFMAALAQHRHWDREEKTMVPA
jgi:catalase